MASASATTIVLSAKVAWNTSNKSSGSSRSISVAAWIAAASMTSASGPTNEQPAAVSAWRISAVTWPARTVSKVGLPSGTKPMRREFNASLILSAETDDRRPTDDRGRRSAVSHQRSAVSNASCR